MQRNTFRIAALMAVSALALSACGGDGDDTKSTEGGGGSDESMTIGIKFDQPGLGLKEGEKYTGMDVDIAYAVADKLGFPKDKVTFKESVSGARETMLETGQVDMIVATYSITDTRKEQVQFAGPYFVAGQDLLVLTDSDITGPDDLDGKLLCSVAGSTSAENVKKDYPGVQLQEYGTYSECLEQLTNGTLDVLTTDDTILAGFAAQDQYAGKLKVVGKPFSEENYGIGLNKDDKRCEEINDILNGLWEDGDMEQIIKDNLGAADYTPNAETNPPTAGGNCA